MQKKILLSFDLDFTLIDNIEGIFNSFQYVFEKYHIRNISIEQVKQTIGLPLDEAFQMFTMIPSNILIDSFRSYYQEKGIYQVKFLPGALDVLKNLKNYPATLGIITSKKQELAIKLLKNLKIYELFDYVLGENESIKKKTDPFIREFINYKYPLHKIIVIGDHIADRSLAETLNCPFIGLLTGNHNQTQLKQESKVPVYILNNIGELNYNTIDKIIEN
ncbi:MAG: HAD-IA family hydrolase [Candidatus Lokiarchaeota archaeon]|nr:HAD-IA family hydrolase [Candidatus Lokiarchaeota archaeon]MBD3202271.1 HAD-IA family hydrolase [Candidatus Lokiarchaeota archaeon]